MIVVINWFSAIGCIGKEHNASESNANLANMADSDIREGMVCLADNGALGRIVAIGDRLKFCDKTSYTYLEKGRLTYIQVCGERK